MNKTMIQTASASTTAPRPYVALGNIRVFGAGLQRAKQTDGKATGYVLSLLNSKDKDGARSALEPFAEMIKGFNALQAGVYNKYTQVYANRKKALNICADFARRFLKDGNGTPLILDDERKEIDALDAKSAKSETKDEKKTRKGEVNYCERVEKAISGAEGISRVNVLLAALEDCELVKNNSDAKIFLDAFADVAIARVKTEAAIKAAISAARVKGTSESEAKQAIVEDAKKARKERARALAKQLTAIAEEK